MMYINFWRVNTASPIAEISTTPDSGVGKAFLTPFVLLTISSPLFYAQAITSSLCRPILSKK